MPAIFTNNSYGVRVVESFLILAGTLESRLQLYSKHPCKTGKSPHSHTYVRKTLFYTSCTRVDTIEEHSVKGPAKLESAEAGQVD